MFEGLSLDQAPPISVVMRFFLSVPIFGIALSLLMIIAPTEVLTPNHPLSLAAIHLLFLGIITMSMIGALFQMQSVLGGRPIPAPAGNAFIIHALLNIGIFSLAGAFITQAAPLYVIAAVLLGSALVYTVFLITPLLIKGGNHSTLRGMLVALVSLFIAALLGIEMADAYAQMSLSTLHTLIRETHYSFALIGWIGALIIAVAFQVVEMFYVTTAYSDWCKRNVFRILPAALALKTLWLFYDLPYVWVFDLLMAGVLMGFLTTTVRRLRERKRRVSDVSIWFWGTGMGLLLIALVSYMLSLVSNAEQFVQIALIAYALFAVSIILGMIGKIVPFLVWFHLNSAGYMDAPIMSNIIPLKRSQSLFGLFVLVSVTAIVSVVYPPLLILAGIIAFALFALLGYNLIGALKLYRYTLDHGTRFEQV
ncbi:hypothetical protein [Sulfuricurvum sp.]|uniref:hypothetical protein n=1 Tax=Sulfuricurvum sp. TaxID=2025608 RepID=UPI00262E6534|nr:hypothetical protein [Sulfuricurvum sp.]MDD2265760.1 hypothetical protein [Sulfuricurvum sp.]MDD2784275.1 hypothetical protein [Sulfuricurvum sp.]